MKQAATNRGGRNGFTLVEVLIAMAAVGVIATVMFALLNFGMTLFAKNVAVNMAHQEARNGMMRVVRDLHRAASIPQLVDATLNPIAPGGATAGISFQVVAKGPFRIANDPASPSLIQLETPGVEPEVGDRLIVFDYDVEADIIKVSAKGAGSNHWNVFLKDGNEKRIQTDSKSFAVCYIMQRVAYVVRDGELRCYPNVTARPEAYHVIAHNITSPTPFSIPPNATGTPDTRYTSVNITAMDPTYSNRGYKNTGMQLVDARVPYRCQMTKYQ